MRLRGFRINLGCFCESQIKYHLNQLDQDNVWAQYSLNGKRLARLLAINLHKEQTRTVISEQYGIQFVISCNE